MCIYIYIFCQYSGDMCVCIYINIASILTELCSSQLITGFNGQIIMREDGCWQSRMFLISPS